MERHRFWELDLARAAAAIGMIAYNWAFALNYFGRADFDLNSGALWALGRMVAFGFVFIAGVSMAISFENASRKLKPSALRRKYLKSGLKIFLFGVCITIATYLFDPKATIWFGVLHLIGISALLAYPLLKNQVKTSTLILLSIPILVAGSYLQNFSFDSPVLLWLGLWPSGWYTFDYFPLLPWAGIFFLGIAMGMKLLRHHAMHNYPAKPSPLLYTALLFGRNTLAIYLIHQPLLLAFILIS